MMWSLIFYSSPNIIQIITSRRGRWETQMKFWFENVKGGDLLEDLGLDRIIILEWLLRNKDNRVGGAGRVYVHQDVHRWPTLASTALKRRVPQNMADFLTSWVTISFTRRTLFDGVR
jgi:hypothetical protein